MCPSVAAFESLDSFSFTLQSTLCPWSLPQSCTFPFPTVINNIVADMQNFEVQNWLHGEISSLGKNLLFGKYALLG